MRTLRFRRRAGWRAAIVVALALSAFGVAGPWAAAASGNTAEDTFTRPDTSSGWGTTSNADGVANLAWQGDFATSSLAVVSGNVGTVDVTTNGHPLSGWLAVPTSAGGDALAQVSLTSVGHGAAAVLVQRASSNQWYEAVLDTSIGELELIRRSAGVNTVVGTPFTVAATAGTKYWLRLDASPSGGSEVLSARVWADGTAEPGTWQTTYTDGTPLAAGWPGALGIWYKATATGDQIDFHAFASSASGLAVAPGAGDAPVFTADSPPTTATAGTAYAGYTFFASGSPAPTYSVASGALPTGMSLNPTTGVLSGTPATAGTYSYAIRASNGVIPAATTPTLTITVAAGTAAAPTITSASTTTAPALKPLTFMVTTTGSPAPKLTVSAGLPENVTFTDKGNGTATMAGTPAAGTEGSHVVTITATNGVNPPATQSFSLVVTASAPTFTADSPGSAVLGKAYSYTFAATGDPAPTYSVAGGALPAGLGLNSTTGVLSGTPTATGTSSFTVTAANGVAPAATTGSLTIVVGTTGVMVTTSVLGGAQGTPVSTSGVTPGSLVPVTAGPPGTRLILSGSGFQPGESVDDVWYNGATQIRGASFYEYDPISTATATGTVLSDMFVPDIYAGSHTVGLVGLTSGRLLTTSFTVTPRLDTGATTAPAGTTLTLGGWGFGARESVTITWNGVTIELATSDNKGAFVKTYVVPAGTAAGAYTLTAKGATTGATTTTPFTVGTVATGPAPKGSDWANWGFDPQAHRVNPTETTIGTGNVTTLAPLWKRQVFEPDLVTSAMNTANGLTFVGSVHGVIYALNSRTGAVVWMYQAFGSVYESPAIANGIVYFSTVTYPNEGVVGNYAYAVNATTGALIWSQALPDGAGWDTPTVVGNRVVVEEANKEAVSGGEIEFSALTGEIEWQFATPYGIWAPGSIDASGTTLYQDTGNPCVSDGVAGDGCSGYLLAVNIATGSYTVLDHFADVSGDDDLATSPAVDGGSLYLGSKNGFEYSVNPSSGAINWSSKTGASGDYGIYSSAVVSAGRVIFGAGDRLVHALNETTGATLWTASVGNGLIYSSPVLANGVLYIESMASTTGTPNLAAINPATGAILWTYSMTSLGENSPTISNGILLAGDDSGSLYAFTPGGT